MKNVIIASKTNSGIERYCREIPNTMLYSLKISNLKYSGVVLEPKIPHIPWMLKKRMSYLFFDVKGLKDNIYGSIDVTPWTDNSIVIIHDVLPLKFNPHLFIRMLIKNNIEKYRSFKNIVAISEHTKNIMVKEHNYNPNNIKVIYPYVSPIFKPLDIPKEKLREELKLPKDKKLLIRVSGGTYNKADNEIPKIMDVLSNEYFLINVTSPGKGIKHERVLNFFNLSDEKLNEFYNVSDLYFANSLDEGFGIPPIEAQATGLTVVGRNIEIYKETMGKSFYTFTDYSWLLDMDEEYLLATSGDPYSVENQEKEYYQSWKYLIEGTAEHIKEEDKIKSIENAKRFSLENFHNNWKNYLKEVDKNE